MENRFKFNGQQYDPITQQYYLRARYYNPVIARFTQEDTYRGDGLNLYAYCRNNPVRYVDPSGHWCDEMERVYQGLKEQAVKNEETITPERDLELRAQVANSAGYYQDSNGTWHRPGSNHFASNDEVGLPAAKTNTANESASSGFAESDLSPIRAVESSGNQPDFYVTPNGQVMHGAAFRLPAFEEGGPTHGVLITPSGQEVNLVSNGGDPKYSNYRNNGHVEQQAAIYMSNNGIDNAVLYINHPNGICNFCNNMTRPFLNEGSTLTVVPPVGATAKTNRWHANPTTYTGSSESPKMNPRYRKD